MATYMGKFTPNLSQVTESLRQIAEQDPSVIGRELQQAFVTAKQ
jgi:hypothetical protein